MRLSRLTALRIQRREQASHDRRRVVLTPNAKRTIESHFTLGPESLLGRSRSDKEPEVSRGLVEDRTHRKLKELFSERW
jgi:hypothetical protein